MELKHQVNNSKKLQTLLLHGGREHLRGNLVMIVENFNFLERRPDSNCNGDATKQQVGKMAQHVHHAFWYNSLPFSAKQQREMTKFKVFWGT